MSSFKYQSPSLLMAALLVLVCLPAATIPAPARAQTETEETRVHNPYHQQNWTTEQREVWETIENWNNAFRENDPDTYFTYIADEITLVLPSGPYRVEGKPDDEEEFRFLLGRGFTKVGFFQEMQPQVGEMTWPRNPLVNGAICARLPLST